MFNFRKAVENKNYSWMNDEGQGLSVPFGFDSYASRSRGAWIDPADPETFGEHQIDTSNWLAVQCLAFASHDFECMTFRNLKR